MTDDMSCSCACHSADAESPGCPQCIEHHETASPHNPEPEQAIENVAAGPERLAPIDELRAMPRPQKLMLAGKADRATRVLLMRDVDPQVLYYLCKNPRITLLSGLHAKHLQALGKSWSVKPQIKQAALKLVLERGR